MAIKNTRPCLNFEILKQEIYYDNIFKSFNKHKNTIEKFIKYYNENRIKKKLGYLNPVEYRKLYTVVL